MRIQGLALSLSLLFPSIALAQAPCGAPAVLDDGWRVTTAEAAGLDPAILCALTERFTAFKQANVHSVLVARHGALVFEQYFAGEDDPWGGPRSPVTFNPALKHDLRSISKSVVSLLVGIAIDRKLIASVDEPVFKFFPEHADLRTPEKDRILIRHVLAMASGLAWDETIPYTDPRNSEIRMGTAADPLRFVLEQPVAAAPGTTYNYGGGDTHLLAAVIQRVSRRTLQEFAREALFEPLGITDWRWNSYSNGAIAAASGLQMRPRDIARLGQLMLTRGIWNERQVVSAAWIEASSTPQIEAIDFLFYGYQWWLGRSLIERKEVHWVAGLGLGGQRLFIVPTLDLVVVITAGLYTSPMPGCRGAFSGTTPSRPCGNRFRDRSSARRRMYSTALPFPPRSGATRGCHAGA
jgi:CubicO group peptidase (beta-lactamase class C family)